MNSSWGKLLVCSMEFKLCLLQGAWSTYSVAEMVAMWQVIPFVARCLEHRPCCKFFSEMVAKLQACSLQVQCHVHLICSQAWQLQGANELGISAPHPFMNQWARC